MTDRLHALTVVLEKHIRDDDAEPILQAISMLKGVATVRAHVSDPEIYSCEVRIRADLLRKMWDMVKGDYGFS